MCVCVYIYNIYTCIIYIIYRLYTDLEAFILFKTRGRSLRVLNSMNADKEVYNRFKLCYNWIDPCHVLKNYHAAYHVRRSR